MRCCVLATLVLVAHMPFAAQSAEGPVPESGFGRLDHVFLIMMENETDKDIIPNRNAPFINAYARQVNRAANYYAVGHPSAPNYLELVGGSNFGLSNDAWPDWPERGCIDHSPGGNGCRNAFHPIENRGIDNAVVATATKPGDCNGQISPRTPPSERNCALRDYPAASFVGKSIADQLVAAGKSWSSFQQGAPGTGQQLLGVNYSDGYWSNLSSPEVFAAAGQIQKLYAVKHNPFAYFHAVQLGKEPLLSLERVKGFDGADGLWASLQTRTPNLSFIVPDQCHDMHGFVAGGPAFCSSATDEQKALLIALGDETLRGLVAAIKSSPAWQRGRNAIVILWDENDYSDAPNKVVMLVETSYAANGRVEARAYDHYSLLRTLEAAFGLPCLNHACDASSQVMNTMFGGQDR